MGSKTVACCYHPTTVVLIDDDESFLKSMRLDLGRGMLCKTFIKPQDALHFLKDQYQEDPYTKRCVVSVAEDSPLQRSIQVDIKPISAEVYNADRYNQISVIVVDQVMPGMKGLALCEQLAGTRFKKILLTGKAKEKDVIDAFNSGIIDKYIPKDANKLSATIKESIQELQDAYFDELSTIVLNSLTEDTNYSSGSCLSDPNFVTFFNKLCQEHAITEYYLTDTDGSFLLLDADGKSSVLVVKDGESMSSTYEIAGFSNRKPSNAVLEKLKSRELILYLHSLKDLRLEAADWSERKLLHPATRLDGTQQPYYYAYIDNLDAYQITPEKIVSFHDYLEQVD